ncbi:hypothetical protein PR048_032791 [Dryococelus australis]|uniref:PiggyBac transposable element-derived protein domain-containing protein n=1 Tax=Dryococelus australis TaxID=614101 RepID=A0ABQ9G372_9NEOP|nr:hypothetical protein PR048_032791 [Dryococelus australis]
MVEHDKGAESTVGIIRYRATVTNKPSEAHLQKPPPLASDRGHGCLNDAPIEATLGRARGLSTSDQLPGKIITWVCPTAVNRSARNSLRRQRISWGLFTDSAAGSERQRRKKSWGPSCTHSHVPPVSRILYGKLRAGQASENKAYIRTLKQVTWRPYVPTLIYGFNEDDQDMRAKCCDRVVKKCYDNGHFTDLIVCSDGATFKLNGTVNRHKCVYWADKSPHTWVEQAVNLPGLTMLYGMSAREFEGSLFFDKTLFSNFTQMIDFSSRKLHRYITTGHRDVSSLLDETFIVMWIDRRERVNRPGIETRFAMVGGEQSNGSATVAPGRRGSFEYLRNRRSCILICGKCTQHCVRNTDTGTVCHEIHVCDRLGLRTTVAEQLLCLPFTKENRVKSPGGSLRIFASRNRAGRCLWSAGLLGHIPFPPPLHSDAALYSTHFTLIGSQYLALKSRLSLSTQPAELGKAGMRPTTVIETMLTLTGTVTPRLKCRNLQKYAEYLGLADTVGLRQFHQHLEAVTPPRLQGRVDGNQIHRRRWARTRSVVDTTAKGRSPSGDWGNNHNHHHNWQNHNHYHHHYNNYHHHYNPYHHHYNPYHHHYNHYHYHYNHYHHHHNHHTATTITTTIAITTVNTINNTMAITTTAMTKITIRILVTRRSGVTSTSMPSNYKNLAVPGAQGCIPQNCCVLCPVVRERATYQALKRDDHRLSAQGCQYLETLEFVNCSHATALNVYHNWTNSTTTNKRRGSSSDTVASSDNFTFPASSNGSILTWQVKTRREQTPCNHCRETNEGYIWLIPYPGESQCPMGGAMGERLDRLSPTQANRTQSPSGSLQNFTGIMPNDASSRGEALRAKHCVRILRNSFTHEKEVEEGEQFEGEQFVMGGGGRGTKRTLERDVGAVRRVWSSAEMQGQDRAGYLRENPPTNGIARYDSHTRESWSDPAGI